MSAELTELQDSARQVLSKLGLPAPETKTWPLIVELGWLLVSVPEELGGLAQGLPGACTLHGELGRSLAAVPYLPAMLALDAVCQSGLPDRESWIERLTTGAYATAPLGESVVTLAQGKLTGLASAVPSADKASHALIDAGDCVALVALGQAGLEVTARPTWDKTRQLSDLRLTNVPLDEALVLARSAAAQALSARLAMQRDFALAADSAGGAAALLDLVVEYLKTRRQFGRPLAMFQALKHRCADLKAQIAAAEALLLDSLGRPGTEAEAELRGKAAKSLACTTYVRVAEEALQLFGGIGMTAEHPCHLFLKRALLNEQLGRRSARYDLDIAADLLGGP